ncbi:MAG: ABC transporter permease [Limnobacter sp.]|nr:ABC transporter permease [Limnobacter sp.]
MQSFSEAFAQAFGLIVQADPQLLSIIALSLQVTFTAVAISCLIAFPLGASLAIGRFPGRMALVVFLNSLMGLPPVVVGLCIYLLLSAAGPLGFMQLLYTPSAMVIAQVVLVTPIVAALARQVIEDLHLEYDELLRAMNASKTQVLTTLLWDARYSLLTSALAGLGRALAEVGAVLIVGGNIANVTRVMTTTIALETSKGELALALGLGIILISLSIAINAALFLLKSAAQRMSYA